MFKDSISEFLLEIRFKTIEYGIQSKAFRVHTLPYVLPVLNIISKSVTSRNIPVVHNLYNKTFKFYSLTL